MASTVYPLCESESDNVYYVNLSVVDKGTPPMSDVSQVEITVDDVNNFTPAFEKASYVSLVDKESPEGMYSIIS